MGRERAQPATVGAAWGSSVDGGNKSVDDKEMEREGAGADRAVVGKSDERREKMG